MEKINKKNIVMNTQQQELVDRNDLAHTTDPYKNMAISMANDHVVRLSVMTEPYI